MEGKLQRLEVGAKGHEIFSLSSFSTPPKQAIIQKVCGHVNELISGQYKSQRGTSSAALLGTKGIGKSLTLRSACVALATMVVKKLIPIYIEYLNEANVLLPSQAISDHLRALGIVVPQSPSLEQITSLLVEQDKFVFLVVDEVEMLYRVPADFKAQALAVLNELRVFTHHPSGRYCCLACGSSAALPFLLTKKLSNETILAEYPLIKEAPSLNETKFPVQRLGVGLLSDVEIQEIIEAQLMMHGALPKELIEITPNLIRLLAGPNIRKMERLFSAFRASDHTSIEALLNTIGLSQPTSERDTTRLQLLIDATLTHLCKKKENKALLSKVPKKFTLQSLLKIEWKEIVPLELEDVEAILTELKDSKVEPPFSKSDFYTLIDEDHFIGDPDLASIYPQTPLQLVFFLYGPKQSIVKKVLRDMWDFGILLHLW